MLNTLGYFSISCDALWNALQCYLALPSNNLQCPAIIYKTKQYLVMPCNTFLCLQSTELEISVTKATKAMCRSPSELCSGLKIGTQTQGYVKIQAPLQIHSTLVKNENFLEITVFNDKMKEKLSLIFLKSVDNLVIFF